MDFDIPIAQSIAEIGQTAGGYLMVLSTETRTENIAREKRSGPENG